MVSALNWPDAFFWVALICTGGTVVLAGLLLAAVVYTGRLPIERKPK